MRFAAPLWFSFFIACGGHTVAGSSGSGGGTEDASVGSSSGTGGASSASGAGGAGASSGSSGQGGNVVAWENECSSTGIAVDKGVGPVVLLDRACPDDGWSLQFYDGATAYQTAPGFSGYLDFFACDATGQQRISLSGTIDGTGTFMLTAGRYQGAPGDDYQLSAGSLTITADGEERQIVEGSYQGTFTPLQNDGPAIQLGGSLRVCHLPVLALP